MKPKKTHPICALLRSRSWKSWSSLRQCDTIDIGNDRERDGEKDDPVPDPGRLLGVRISSDAMDAIVLHHILLAMDFHPVEANLRESFRALAAGRETRTYSKSPG